MQLSNSLIPKSSASSGYLLRQYGGAAAAYSLQRLDTSSENVVRVRRSTDDSESDFNSQEVVDGTLAAFCGAGDGFVTTWYDQSGSLGQPLSRFANRATAADRRMQFDGVDDRVNFADNAVFDLADYVDIRLTFMANSTAGTTTLISKGSGTATNYAIDVSGGKLRFYGYASGVLKGDLSTFDVSENTIYSVRCVFDGTDWVTYVDGNLESTTTDAATLTTNATVFSVGSRGGGGNYINGVVYDVSIYNSGGTQTFAANGYGNTDADWTDQVGSNDGTVNGSPSLYEGRNATQATAANQPQIVADGVVVTDANGNASMDFDGVNDWFDLGFAAGANSGYLFLSVASSDNLSVPQNLIDFRDANDDGIQTVATSIGDFVARTDASDATIAYTAGLHLFTGEYDSADVTAYLDGSGGTSVAGADTNGAIDGVLGATAGTQLAPWNGSMSEAVIYLTDQSSNRTAIESNIANRYGITLA